MICARLHGVGKSDLKEQDKQARRLRMKKTWTGKQTSKETRKKLGQQRLKKTRMGAGGMKN